MAAPVDSAAASPWSPAADDSHVPYTVLTDAANFEREQARFFRGPTWHFLALEDELRQAGDLESTWIGTTPVVVTRTKDDELKAWVNRCARCD